MYYCPFVTLDFDAAVIHDELIYRWSPPPSRSPGSGEGCAHGGGMARCGDHAWVALLARCRMTLALVVATFIEHSASLTCRGQNGRRSAKVPDEALEGLNGQGL
jgi:hypothetical protein